MTGGRCAFVPSPSSGALLCRRDIEAVPQAILGIVLCFQRHQSPERVRRVATPYALLGFLPAQEIHVLASCQERLQTLLEFTGELLQMAIGLGGRRHAEKLQKQRGFAVAVGIASGLDPGNRPTRMPHLGQH